MSTNIKVCVRVRPENEKERAAEQNPVVCVIDESLLMFDPVYDQRESYFHGRLFKDPTSRKPREAKFAFDKVFGPSATNIEVYEQTTKEVLRNLVEGFNCSVFAYGATGAGKTFSMLGSPKTPGVIFLSMMDLYNIKELDKEERAIDVSVSYLEVYNENIKDLLCPGSASLPIRENGRQGIVIPGLTVREPESAEELLQMLEKGNKNRTQHPTDANAESSRSHAVFQVFVKVRGRSAALSQNVKVSKLSLIDLAGSERATVTKNQGARFREGANINKSLLALGNCINALADTKRKGNKHIPYRNSKLTRILKDSLGDNCKTVMLAAVSPSRQSYEDTYNTLSYADRAKKIKAVLKRNVINVSTHVQNYGKVVDELHAEISSLKAKLQTQTIQLAEYAAQATTATVHQSCNFDIDQLQTDISKAYGERRQIRDDLLHIEMMQKGIAITMSRKQTILDRLDKVSASVHRAGNKTVGKIERAIGAANHKQRTLDVTKAREQERLEENTSHLKSLLKRGSAIDNPHAQMILSLQMKAYHYEQESREWQKQNQHLTKTVHALQESQRRHEKLVQMFLAFLDTSQSLLSNYGLEGEELANMYSNIKRNVVDEKDVTFNCDEESDTEMKEFKTLIQLPLLSANDHSLDITGQPIIPQPACANDTIAIEDGNATFSLPNVDDSPSKDSVDSTFTGCQTESSLVSPALSPAATGLLTKSLTAGDVKTGPSYLVSRLSTSPYKTASELSDKKISQSLDNHPDSPRCKFTEEQLRIACPETSVTSLECSASSDTLNAHSEWRAAITSTPVFRNVRQSPRFNSRAHPVFRPVAEVLHLTKGTGCDELDDSPDCPPAKIRVIGTDLSPSHSRGETRVSRTLIEGSGSCEDRVNDTRMDSSGQPTDSATIVESSVWQSNRTKTFADAVKQFQYNNTNITKDIDSTINNCVSGQESPVPCLSVRHLNTDPAMTPFMQPSKQIAATQEENSPLPLNSTFVLSEPKSGYAEKENLLGAV
ncbi:kinesin-like protein KIF18A [Watersipora subatra]|uniref:kinesin-like protein KIF18A n=1 Tax=Watersipora subatra TaxID=2589382 RepID=UPI00355B39E8